MGIQECVPEYRNFWRGFKIKQEILIVPNFFELCIPMALKYLVTDFGQLRPRRWEKVNLGGGKKGGNGNNFLAQNNLWQKSCSWPAINACLLNTYYVQKQRALNSEFPSDREAGIRIERMEWGGREKMKQDGKGRESDHRRLLIWGLLGGGREEEGSMDMGGGGATVSTVNCVRLKIHWPVPLGQITYYMLIKEKNIFRFTLLLILKKSNFQLLPLLKNISWITLLPIGPGGPFYKILWK